MDEYHFIEKNGCWKQTSKLQFWFNGIDWRMKLGFVFSFFVSIYIVYKQIT